jgi:hypothetical protein
MGDGRRGLEALAERAAVDLSVLVLWEGFER